MDTEKLKLIVHIRYPKLNVDPVKAGAIRSISKCVLEGGDTGHKVGGPNMKDNLLQAEVRARHEYAGHVLHGILAFRSPSEVGPWLTKRGWTRS